MRTHLPTLAVCRRALTQGAWLAVCMVALTFASVAQDTPANDTAPQNSADDPATSVDEGTYLLGVGDKIVVAVYEGETAPETCLVRPDGMVTLPLVGELQAAGTTPVNLARRIAKSLEKYYSAPTVTVSVEEINSYRVFVLGQVGTQQMIESVTPLRLLQALAMAGGINDFSSGRLVVLREEDGRQSRMTYDYSKIIKGRTPAANVWLQSGDIIVVE